MKIEILRLGQLQTNCYIAHCGGEAIIIDPADEAEFIAEKIQRLDLKPSAILATHGHFDHILAAGELQMIFNIPFYIHPADEFLLKNMNSSASFWLKSFGPSQGGQKINRPLPRIIKSVKNESVINLGGCELKVMETPGHTPGSVCFLADSIIFSGDTLFKSGIGRTDFAYSDKNALDKSLEKIFRLPPKTVVYPGHDEKTAIEIELRN
ncbi:MBL fold metallo-hydrolase [Candidatus Wolfebacteria bacterium]|nr:MBL fold metallo-hydrolase [Candidatus Wolfebacteria bacterium]